MTTIGGFAFRHLDRLPKTGDSISVEDITITVLEMDEHRIARVRVSRGMGGDEGGADTPPEAGEGSEALEENQPDLEAHVGETVDSGSEADLADTGQSTGNDGSPETARATDDGVGDTDRKTIH